MEHLLAPYEDLSGFLAHIEEAKRVNKSSHAEKVTLMTIHQAKGLEFKCMIVPGLTEGILPHINSVNDPANMEEAMYVEILQGDSQIEKARIMTKEIHVVKETGRCANPHPESAIRLWLMRSLPFLLHLGLLSLSTGACLRISARGKGLHASDAQSRAPPWGSPLTRPTRE